MPAQVEQTTIKPPTLIIVGDVVSLHKKLAWFNTSN
jgi:siroheme synthase